MGGFVKLIGANVQSAAPSFDGLSVAADFGTGGLKLFDVTWTQLSPLDPQGIWVG